MNAISDLRAFGCVRRLGSPSSSLQLRPRPFEGLRPSCGAVAEKINLGGGCCRVLEEFHYDEAGNLRFRANTGVSAETFGYDALNRLTSAQGMSPGTPYSESYAYNAIGNLTSKAAKTYTYGTCGAGPHAVCTVGGGAAFTYDPNGNMLSSNGRTVSYNAQNKSIHMSGNGAEIAFIYDADGNRVVQAVTGGSASGRTIYVGLGATGKSLYERTTRGSTTEHVQFLYAGSHHGGNAFALKVLTETNGSSSTSAVKYNHFDHLGSVTAVSDQTGRLSGAATGAANAGLRSYDAWGARRDPHGGSSSTSFVLESGRREFTGHETIPDVGLVNMNGRVYDPAIGRFLTPDPHIQFLANLQSYNRYSYVLNNPLSLTDPTGYFAGAPAWVDYAVNGTLLVIAVAFPVCAPAAFYVGMAYNAVSAISNGASVEQVIVTTAIGLATANIGSGVGNSLVSNSVMAQLIGGAVGGGLGAAWSTMYYGGNLGENVLRGAAMGAVSAAVTVGVQKVVSVTQASVAETGGRPAPPVGGTALRAQDFGLDLGDLDLRPFRLSRQDAENLFGGVDLSKDTNQTRFPSYSKWIVRYKIDPGILSDPSYNMLNASTGKRVTHLWVNRAIVPMLDDAFRNLQANGLLGELGTFDGDWVVRAQRGGGTAPSGHSWGTAIDFNATANKQGSIPTMHPGVVRAFTDAGFTWGGMFGGRRVDGMHFSLGF